MDDLQRKATSLSPAPEGEEKKLALAFKGGDDRAYDAIYQRYVQRVRSICRKMLVDGQDVDEATQETFLRVYQGLGRFNGQYQLGAWVARITTNVCLDHLRSQNRKPCEPADPNDLGLLLEESPGPEVAVMKRFEGRRVTRVLRTLPPIHRAAIVLRDVEGLSYAEIAECLDLSEQQVKALLHRARKSFRRKWSPAVASIFFPWRLIPKLRQAEQAVRDPSSSVGFGAQFVVQCSGTLQQCGQFVSERVSSLVTATVIGTAAVTGATSGGLPAPFVSAPAMERVLPTDVERANDDTGGVSKSHAPVDGPDSEEAPAASPSPTPASSSEGGDSAEAPAPTPSQSPAGGSSSLVPGPSPSASPKPSPTPVVEPQGFSFIGVVGGPQPRGCSSCYRGTEILSESGRSTGEGLSSYSQRMNGTLLNSGSRAYGIELTHRSPAMSEHELSFLLWTDEGGYSYSARGTRIASSRTSWGGYEYTFSGSFTKVGGPRADEYTPPGGNYELTITFSESQKKLTSTKLSLLVH